MRRKLTAITLAAVMLLALAVPAAAAESLPTAWDLTEIYASPQEWQADYDAAMELLDQYEQFRGKLNNAQSIYDYLQFRYYTELTRLQSKLEAYVSLGTSLDYGDPVFAELGAKLDAMDNKEAQLSAFADPEIFSLSLEEREEIFSDPLFDGYAYDLRWYTDPDEEPLGEEAELVRAILSMAYGYPKAAYERMLYMEIPDPVITMPDGSVETLTDGLYQDIVNSDEYTEDFKLEAYCLMVSRTAPYINTMATLLEGNAAEAYANAILGDFETTRAYAMDMDDVEPAIYDLVIDAAHAGTPDYQRYLRAHARALGLEDQYYFDLTTASSGYDPGKTDFDDAVATVEKALAVLGEDYVDTFHAIVSAGHVDVYPNDAKDTGAFETQPSSEYLPWVLLNYYGRSRDISDLAHEMGHAVYDAWSTENQPKQYQSPTIFTQEVASTVNELLYYSYRIENAADDDERIAFLEDVLFRFSVTFFRQACFAEFEDYFYGLVESGSALDAETLSDKWMELTEQYRGDALKTPGEYRGYWAEITHYYEIYYVYQYACAITYAASIVQRIMAGEEGAVEAYHDFLKAGCSASPRELLALADIDPLAEETYQSALEYFSGLVDEYELLVEEKLAEEPAA